LNGPVKVVEYELGNELKTYEISSENFEYQNIHPDKIKGLSASENASIILSILKEKKKSDAYFIVAANAALGLYASGYSKNLIECKDAAEESINSGMAFKKLTELKKYSSNR
jgi:anthranilate phosphoribosyltransferase